MPDRAGGSRQKPVVFFTLPPWPFFYRHAKFFTVNSQLQRNDLSSLSAILRQSPRLTLAVRRNWADRDNGGGFKRVYGYTGEFFFNPFVSVVTVALILLSGKQLAQASRPIFITVCSTILIAGWALKPGLSFLPSLPPPLNGASDK